MLPSIFNILGPTHPIFFFFSQKLINVEKVSSWIIISGFKMQTNSPFAIFKPVLTAFEKP